MRIKVLALCVFLVASWCTIAQTSSVKLNGVYKGKNLYVQNPFTGNMKDFCTIEVLINGEKKMTGIQSSAYEIDLSTLKMGDPVAVEIRHSDDCKPKILNPQVIRNDQSEFHFLAFNVADDKLTWSTKGESTNCKMYMQQFTRGQWINVDEVKGKGLPTQADYSHTVTHHNGLNKYRIKYLDVHGMVVYSHIVEFSSSEEDITFYPSRVSTSITLSRTTDYEIMDSYGNVVKKGNGAKIDCIDLKSGVYYLNMHNQTEKFFKK